MDLKKVVRDSAPVAVDAAAPFCVKACIPRQGRQHHIEKLKQYNNFSLAIDA